jgi:proline racemase
LGQAALAGEDTFAQAMVNFRKSLDEKEQSLRAGAGLSASRAYDAAKGQLKDEARFSKAGIVGKYEGTVSK